MIKEHLNNALRTNQTFPYSRLDRREVSGKADKVLLFWPDRTRNKASSKNDVSLSQHTRMFKELHKDWIKEHQQCAYDQPIIPTIPVEAEKIE